MSAMDTDAVSQCAGTFMAHTSSVALGDTVIIYSSPKNMTFTKVTAGETFHNAYGTYPHDDMIGKEWGSKVVSKSGKGFVYLMYPSPEMWTLSLPHRTQILYQPDISLVTTLLDLRPGAKMIEAGTGSGSFSHAIVRTIAPTGHLYTFEFSQDRYEKAKAEFEEHGLAKNTTIQHRDVCKDGFADADDLVDAVFLDLPAPWEALAAAKKAFKRKKTGRICSFSPCMEQVLRTCDALKEVGFVEIQMFEVLVRPYEVRQLPHRSFPKPGDVANRHVQGRQKRKTMDDDSSAPPSGTATPVQVTEEDSIVGTKPQGEVRGHTSYLTFATLLPQELPKRRPQA